MIEALRSLPKDWSYSGIAPDQTVGISSHNVVPNQSFLALYVWASKYGIGLEPLKSTYWDGPEYDSEIWTTFKVSEEFAITEKFFGNGQNLGTQACHSCYKLGLAALSVKRRGGGATSLCPVCAGTCESCTNNVWPAEYVASEKLLCSACNPVYKCGICRKQKSSKDEPNKGADTYSREKKIYQNSTNICPACLKVQTCGNCSLVFHRGVKLVNFEGVNHCPICHEEKVLKDFETYEKFRLEELPKGGFTIKSLPARPIRTISIETEVDGDKRMLCKTLYDGGLIRIPEVERYGSQTPDQSKWAAFLKHDGSVTGGELISFMLDLSKKEHSDSLKTTLRKLRALETAKFIEFNPNCGGHIHIDAHGFGTENIWRLLTVWNYLEDFTYRLAGAGAKYGHRTLVPGHDRANGGHGYANPTIKGPWGVKSSVGQAVRQQDRMCGLNFQPYLRAGQFCGCGAFQADNARNCKCQLPKNTIEWRVWNSQRNPRILHAWLAYMQAIHAFADVDEEPTAAFEKRFPTLAWTQKEWKSLNARQQDSVFKRIHWCFANLVLTVGERDSLVYAIEKSDIPVSTSFKRELLDIKPVSENSPIHRGAKFNKQNSRLQKIVIEAPKPGDNPLGNKSQTILQERRRIRLIGR